MVESKANIRKHILLQREALSSTDVKWASERVIKNFIAHESRLLTQPFEVVALYSAIKNEILTEALFTHFHENRKKCVFPKVDYKKQGLSFHVVQNITDLIPGPLGILEPLSSAVQMHPEIVFIPGVAFSKNCYRLGYGAGFYDRFLSDRETKPCLTIGLAYDFQVLEKLPTESHDLPLDFVISERFICQRSGI